ncbi:family 16 glycosylhydrolase [Rhizobiaceae bacterium n13]|uniref:Family 16 glycosylhydrolase n=1 Tax=Ferirhizobium litorale TaxID=2927786 RepID=A0AAE3QE23_9HYPH|nr:family 16 glycosylhydrolase [Fererhizobium litorale]MDI7862974.1 family 16 glycosylhydrolase [Fererhizobium litorale]MDI7924047.1 family 16 glycosylhydrolase [Fererhizobium litorale]
MMPYLSRRGFLAACLAAQPVWQSTSWANEAPDDPTIGRELVFEDGFRTLDWSVWEAGPKATIDSTGFYGRSAFATKYGDEGFNPYSIVDEPAAENGKALQISAKYIGRPMNIHNYYGNDLPEFQWISGNLQAARADGTILKGWRKGYFEARMIFPRHPITWPAFWMLNGRSILEPKTSIELDIIEHKGWEPTVYGTYLHEWGGPDEHNRGTGVETPVDMTTQYCRYGMLVDDTRCVPFFERKPVIDTSTGKPADWPITRSARLDAELDVFWPLLTLALRTDVPFPQPLRDEDKLVHMKVDYFRVYA